MREGAERHEPGHRGDDATERPIVSEENSDRRREDARVRGRTVEDEAVREAAQAGPGHEGCVVADRLQPITAHDGGSVASWSGRRAQVDRTAHEQRRKPDTQLRAEAESRIGRGDADASQRTDDDISRTLFGACGGGEQDEQGGGGSQRRSFNSRAIFVMRDSEARPVA